MRKLLGLSLLLFTVSLAAPVAGVQNYESGFESDSTGSLPPEWRHHQDRNSGYCSGSGCEVGYNTVTNDRSSSGSKAIECLERSNGRRHCYIPIDVPSSSDSADVSFDYLLKVNGMWTNAVVCINDDSLFDDSNTNCNERIKSIDQDWGSGTVTEGWGSVNNYDISSYSGRTIYLDMWMDGRHSGDLGAWARVTLDNVDIDVEVNRPPNVGSPSPTTDVHDLDANLEVYASGESGEDLHVDFYDGSGNLIGDESVGRRGTANTRWGGLNCGNHYSWSVEVSDGEKTASKGEWTFGVDCPSPNTPNNVRPHEADQKGLTPEISAEYPGGGYPGDLQFQTSGDMIDSCGQVSGGDRCSVEFDSADQYGETYFFEVRAVEEATGKASGWVGGSFTTNYRPQIDDVRLSKSSDSHAVDLSYTVSDGDGEEDLSQCSVTVEDGDGDTLTESTSPVESGGDQLCDFGEVGHEDREGWSHLAELDFELSVEDQQGASSSLTRTVTLPNHKPGLDAIEFQSYPNRNAFGVSTGINYVDNGTSEIRSCTIVIDDGDQSYSAGSLEKVGSTARCVQENIGPAQFSGITLDEEITVTVRATDIHGSTVERQTFYNVPTALQSDYSAVVLQAGGVSYLDYRVVNQAGTESTYRTELEGVNATFTPSGNETAEYNLTRGESRTFSIEILPDRDISGKKYINITTENLDTGLEKTHSMPVGVYQPGSPPAQPVPGLNPLQLFLLIFAATFVYWRRQNGI